MTRDLITSHPDYRLFGTIANSIHEVWRSYENDFESFLKTLDRPRRAVALITVLTFEVCNGGFFDWANNGYGAHWTDTYAALKAIDTEASSTIADLVHKIGFQLVYDYRGNLKYHELESDRVAYDAMDATFYATKDQLMLDAGAWLRATLTKLLVGRLNALYDRSEGRYGRAVSDAVAIIRQAGVSDPVETTNFLQASTYGTAPAGTIIAQTVQDGEAQYPATLYVWKVEVADLDGRIHLVTPHGDQYVYHQPFDQQFHTIEGAVRAKKDYDPNAEWVLCELRMTPISPSSRHNATS